MTNSERVNLVMIDRKLFVLDPGSPPGLKPLSADAGILHARSRGMTKNQRIKQLEDKVRTLEATITEQTIRIGVLEARPLIMPTIAPVPSRYPPPGPFTLEMPQCTCGSTAGCPLHGPQFISGANSVVIHPGHAPWSWDSSTIDADGHVQ